MNKKIVGIVVITLITGVAAGYWLSSWHTTAPGQGKETAVSAARKPLFYRNPMNPTVTSPVPAKDGMGMDYVPVYADDLTGGGSAGTVVIDPTVVQNIGVRTALASRKAISRSIKTVGRLAYDEELLTRFHPKISGWVEKLFVSETGEAVKPGTMLLSVYSPQLVASEQEYLLALKNAETLAKSPFADIRKDAQALLRSSRERLELLDVPAHQIRELERTRKTIKALHIQSPVTGIVLKIGAREGQHITPRTELYKIADLSKIWVYVDVYEYEIPWVRLNDAAEMRLVSVPGRVFKGKIAYIYPYLDPKTRTNKVRLEFDNPNLLFKPDMFADVILHPNAKPDALVIPTAAIIRTGEVPKVFVQVGKGTFEPRRVNLGLQAGDETEILSGLKTGERVVTSAQFLLDSESSLVEAAAKMVEPKENIPQTQKRGDMKGMKGMKMDQEKP